MRDVHKGASIRSETLFLRPRGPSRALESGLNVACIAMILFRRWMRCPLSMDVHDIDVGVDLSLLLGNGCGRPDFLLPYLAAVRRLRRLTPRRMLLAPSRAGSI